MLHNFLEWKSKFILYPFILWATVSLWRYCRCLCFCIFILIILNHFSATSSFVKKLEIQFSGIDTSLNSFNELLQNIFVTYPTLSNLQISFFNVKHVYGLSSLKAMQSFIELWNQQLFSFNKSNNCNIQLFWEMECVKKLDFKVCF